MQFAHFGKSITLGATISATMSYLSCVISLFVEQNQNISDLPLFFDQVVIHVNNDIFYGFVCLVNFVLPRLFLDLPHVSVVIPSTYVSQSTLWSRGIHYAHLRTHRYQYFCTSYDILLLYVQLLHLLYVLCVVLKPSHHKIESPSMLFRSFQCNFKMLPI